MTVIIGVLLASALKNDAVAADFLKDADVVLAADGGAEHAARLSLPLHTLAGDFDSVSPTVRHAFEASGTPLIQVPVKKDETDAELVIRLALQHAAGAAEPILRVAGGLGGRLDHELGTLLLLAEAAKQGVRVESTDGETFVTLLHGPADAEITWPPAAYAPTHGWYVSTIALDNHVHGLSYEGLEYALDDFSLPFGSTRGISNEKAGPLRAAFGVSLRTGLLAVIVTPKR